MKNNRHSIHCFCLFFLVLLVSACADWPAIEKVFGGTQDEKNIPAPKEKQVVAAQVEDTQESKKNTGSEKGKQAAVTAKQEQATGWGLQCGRNEKRCYIRQNVLTPKSKKIFVGVSVSHRGANEKPRLLFSLPLGIMLAPGLSFDIDSGQKIKLPVRICITDGCKADMGLGEKLVTRLKQGKQMNVFFVNGATQKTIKVVVSLQGFTQAYAALSTKK